MYPPFLSWRSLLSSLGAAIIAASALADPPWTEQSVNVLQLQSDTDATYSIGNFQVRGSNSTLTLDAGPATNGIADRTLTLNGTVSFGFYMKLNVTSPAGYTLNLRDVISNQPGSTITASTANVAITHLSASAFKLDGGPGTHNTLGNFTGSGDLDILGGKWTLTGNNASQGWSTSIEGGTLAIAPGAAPGAGAISVSMGATLQPPFNATLAGSVSMHSGGCLSMMDAVIGTYTIGKWAPASGAVFKLIFDIGLGGVDKLVFNDTGNGNDYGDFVVLNFTGSITPGTYIIAEQKTGSIVENHFGFGFKGDPANHDNIIKTKTLGGYSFTLDTQGPSPGDSGYAGNYNEYTLTVSNAK